MEFSPKKARQRIARIRQVLLRAVFAFAIGAVLVAVVSTVSDDGTVRILYCLLGGMYAGGIYLTAHFMSWRVENPTYPDTLRTYAKSARRADPLGKIAFGPVTFVVLSLIWIHRLVKLKKFLREHEAEG